MGKRDDGTAPQAAASTPQKIDQFLTELDRLKPLAPARQSGIVTGRLIMALDATLSRQPSWDLALQLQAGMFDAVAALGGLSVQLVYFRGLDECRASRWVDDAAKLKGLMQRVHCQGGTTQIGRVLDHALAETANQRVDALVFVGDACEESLEDIGAAAARLGIAGVPVFVFQEGWGQRAARAFAEIARLTAGAHCRFDLSAADHIARLLQAVAVYATGGYAALTALSRDEPAARQLAGLLTAHPPNQPKTEAGQ